ncbi:MAG TPA: WbqC family protein [Rhodanobacteraceae bacterium]|nr:WbqC family protein [Rhodanobacteraceae bacterium]
MKSIAILQSNYLPWKGYFDIIASVDEFVLYDSVQYTKNDWRNRNQVKTANGKAWLTVPVRHSTTDQLIEETEIADKRCFRKHWNTIWQSYAKAKNRGYLEEHLQPILCMDDVPDLLSQMNARLIRSLCIMLGIRTTIIDSRAYDVAGDRNERLISICKRAGAERYVSGPSASSYLDVKAFEDAGVEIKWMDYRGYREYPQPYPPFDHQVSIVDLLACMGHDAMSCLLAGNRQ